MGAHKVGSEGLSTAPKLRRKVDFQSFDLKICCGQTEESWTTTSQDHSNHRPCQRKLARWLRRGWRRRRKNTFSYTKWLSSNAYQNNNVKNTSSSASFLSSLHVVVPSTSASTLASTEQTSAKFSTHQVTHPLPQMPVTHALNESAGHQFNNCIVNIQNDFRPQSTNQASSSRVECQIGELARSPSFPRRKRRRAYIIVSDEGWTFLVFYTACFRMKFLKIRKKRFYLRLSIAFLANEIFQDLILNRSYDFLIPYLGMLSSSCHFRSILSIFTLCE